MPPLRSLAHDLRSLLAAATTNLEYTESIEGMPPEAVEVVAEVRHELRLLADVLDVYAGAHASDRVVELDLRAPLWLARSRKRIIIDPTTPPWLVRGAFGAIQALASAILSAVHESRETRVDVRASSFILSQVEPLGIARIVDAAGALRLVARIEGTSVTLERSGKEG